MSLGSADAATCLLGGESDFRAATPDAIAFFAATVGLPSFFVVVCPDAATLFLGGEDDFYAAMPAAFARQTVAMELAAALHDSWGGGAREERRPTEDSQLGSCRVL